MCLRVLGVFTCVYVCLHVFTCVYAPSLARLLFNNNDSSHTMDHQCPNNNCSLCHSGIINKVISTVTGNEYRVDETLSCVNGRIYVITGKCLGEYISKIIHFGVRGNEHFLTNASSIHKHKQECTSCIGGSVSYRRHCS